MLGLRSGLKDAMSEMVRRFERCQSYGDRFGSDFIEVNAVAVVADFDIGEIALVVRFYFDRCWVRFTVRLSGEGTF